TREELTHFLADKLSTEEQYSLVAHLESCVACLQALENLLDADPEPGAFLPQAWRSRMPPTRPAFLDRLKALRPGSTPGTLAVTQEPSLPAVPGYEILTCL